ncbi:ABC transporter permease [Corynebacterium hansenii]|uniref:ABC transporter permease n=1 Tax=Corynebacterium hansenii TaxID=394964 RepID=A0ABV7ZRY1_9CORY|nr:ABC transporter permease subunit [Corynebacterium hansenii]WJY99704.1 ABC-2 family transporter protein [Corynebacterium hansenii]
MNAMREVLALELTQRARSTRWRALLIGWFVVLSGTVLLQTLFFRNVGPGLSGDEDAWAAASAEATASGTLLFVLLVGLLVAPAQTATSINGDRRDGVLALIQAAPIPTWAVAVGKLMAAWLSSLAFLLVSLPVLVWTVIRGGMPWWALLLGTVVVALLLLAVSGMGLGVSALTPRTASSTMLSYLIVAVLVIGLPMVFLLSMPLTEHRETRQVAYMVRYEENLDLGDTTTWCREEMTEIRTMDTRRIAWLLPPNPVVVLSDALPYKAELAGVTPIVRDVADRAFREPERQPETCAQLAESMREPETGAITEPTPPRSESRPGWKWAPGLAVNLLLGALGVAFAHRRLRVPAGELPKGVRIA